MNSKMYILKKIFFKGSEQIKLDEECIDDKLFCQTVQH